MPKLFVNEMEIPVDVTTLETRQHYDGIEFNVVLLPNRYEFPTLNIGDEIRVEPESGKLTYQVLNETIFGNLRRYIYNHNFQNGLMHLEINMFYSFDNKGMGLSKKYEPIIRNRLEQVANF